MIRWEDRPLPARTTEQRRREAYEAIIYFALLMLLLGLLYVERRAASEDATRHTDVRASVKGTEGPKPFIQNLKGNQ